MSIGELIPLSTKRIVANTQYELNDIVVSADNKFVYTVGRKNHSEITTNGFVFCYKRALNGSLSQLQTIEVNSHYPNNLLIAPSGKFLYTLSAVGCEVFCYTINENGELVFKQSIGWGTSAFVHDFVISPDGKNIYVGREGDFAAEEKGSIVEITVNTVTGEMSNATIFRAEGFELYETVFLAISPDGTHVFSTGNSHLQKPKFGRVSRNLITGSLTFQNLYSTTGNTVRPFTSPSGKFLYISMGNGEVAQFSLNSSSEPTPLTPPNFSDNMGEVNMAFTSNENFVYTGKANNEIGQYSYNKNTGILTPLKTPSIPVDSESTEISVLSLALSTNNEFLYVGTAQGYVYEFSTNRLSSAKIKRPIFISKNPLVDIFTP